MLFARSISVATMVVAALVSSNATAASVQVSWSTSYTVWAGPSTTFTETFTIGGSLLTVDSSEIGAPIDLNGRHLVANFVYEIGSNENVPGYVATINVPSIQSEVSFVFTSTDLAALAGDLVGNHAEPFPDALRFYFSSAAYPSRFRPPATIDPQTETFNAGGFDSFSLAVTSPVVYTFAVVPEPCTAAIAAVGLALVAVARGCRFPIWIMHG